MKKILITLFASFLLVACGSQTSEVTPFGDDALGTIAQTLQPAIDSWLESNKESLNEWGRAKDAAAPSKESLYDEDLGRSLNRYEYIVKYNQKLIPTWTGANKKNEQQQ